MRKYETVFISDPDLSDQDRSDLFDKVREIITKEKGIILDFDEWGNKKLAYEIRKKFRGHYVCITYGGTGELVQELERNFRLMEVIMKFMTIVLSQDTSAEALEKEFQEEKATRKEVKDEEDADDSDKKEDEDSDEKDEDKEVETSETE